MEPNFKYKTLIKILLIPVDIIAGILSLLFVVIFRALTQARKLYSKLEKYEKGK